MNIAIIGGGQRCRQLMELVTQDHFVEFGHRPRVVAVADTRPDAVGIRYARELGLFTTAHYNDFFTRNDIDLIIELTGDDSVFKDVLEKKPPGVRVISAETVMFMNVAIVGGGERCRQITELITKNDFGGFIHRPRVVAVADTRPDAAGMKYARELGLFTTADYNDFFARDDIDLIIELSDNQTIFNDILKKKSTRVRAISTETAIFMWQLGNLAHKAQKMGQQLQETRALYKVFINELIQEDVLVIGTDYRIIDINETLSKKLGIGREQAIGRFCYEITHRQNEPCNGKSHPCPLVETLRTGKPSQATHNHPGLDNAPTYYAISCYPLIEEGRTVGAVEISRNITGDLQMQKLMMQQEKLASIGRLSAGVAHEINNPLTTILTSAMLIQEDLDKSDPAYDEMTTIANEALRCRKIVASLLDFARQNAPEKKRHHLNNVVLGSITLTRKQAAFKDIDIRHTFTDDIPDIFIDKHQIQQAVINLILNAVDASAPGGTVTVETRLIDSGCVAEITVTDDGEGIPEDRLEKIFDPFFTTKDTGTGLGLAITHGIVEQHGGVILADSHKGKGSTFTIKLPYSAGTK